ncbi:MAG: SIS domain-containing protein [Candidatus Dormibacteria bacterium]
MLNRVKQPSTQSAAEESIRSYLERVRKILLEMNVSELEALLTSIQAAWDDDRTVFIIGNGGSAATASHMATDLSKQTEAHGRKPLRALSLSDNMALITALANDTDYSRIYSEQLRIHGRPGDLLIAISCSGESPNILAAIDEARANGIQVLGLGGGTESRMQQLADVFVSVPSEDYGHIESIHLVIDHCITTLLSGSDR